MLINLSKIMKFRQVILKVLKMEVASKILLAWNVGIASFLFWNRQFIRTHLN